MSARRGFALPLVLLVTLVATVMLTLMLTRHNTQSLAVQRDLDRYATHHISKGVEEVVNNWMRTFGTKSMPEMLDEGGLGLVLAPDDGAAVQISFFDAQGAVLTDLAGLPAKSREQALDILARVRGLRGQRDRYGRPYTRKFGPVAVSANSAPEPILRAVVESALGLDPGSSNATSDAIVSGILSARPGDRNGVPAPNEPFPSGKLEEVFTRASVEQAALEKLRQLIVETPSLWSFTVVPAVRSSDPNVEEVRFEGLLLAGSSGRDRSSGGVQRTSPVVSLNRVRSDPADIGPAPMAGLR